MTIEEKLRAMDETTKAVGFCPHRWRVTTCRHHLSPRDGEPEGCEPCLAAPTHCAEVYVSWDQLYQRALVARVTPIEKRKRVRRARATT